MEGEGEADRKEESAEPRGGGGARAVEGEAETEADRRCEAGAGWRCRAVGEMAGPEASSARGREITPRPIGRGRSCESAVPEAETVRKCGCLYSNSKHRHLFFPPLRK